jgi:hypothetical protein
MPIMADTVLFKIDSLAARLDAFEEDNHPRDGDGKFTSGSSKVAEVKRLLDALPRVPKENRWLHPKAVSEYTSDFDEVYTKDLPGIKMATSENVPMATQRHHGSATYKKTELQRINLSNVYYTQPQVNPGKLEYFVENYHPKSEDFHQNDNDASGKWGDAPRVNLYPDGSITSTDHHRLIASSIRGDRTAIARVTTWENKGGELVQVRSKKGKNLNDPT